MIKNKFVFKGEIMKSLIFIVILFFLIKGGTEILFDIFFGGKK